VKTMLRWQRENLSSHAEVCLAKVGNRANRSRIMYLLAKTNRIRKTFHQFGGGEKRERELKTFRKSSTEISGDEFVLNEAIN
jgi:hypothetical protein